MCNITRVYFLALFICCSLIAYSEPSCQIDQKNKMAVLANQWIEMDIHFGNGIINRNVEANQDRFIWPLRKKNNTFFPHQGSQTVLFTSADLSEQIPFSAKFKASTVDFPSKTVLQISSTDNQDLSIDKAYSLNSDQSVVMVTTTIRNESDEDKIFYPAEIICFNAGSTKNSQVMNANTHFFAPIVDHEPFYEIVLGHEDRKSVSALPFGPILSVSYENKLGAVKSKLNDNWLAFFRGPSGHVYGNVFALEWWKPSVDSNQLSTTDLTLFMNGQGEYEQDGRKIVQTENAEKYMRATLSFGKATLKPSSELTYVMRWSVSMNLQPIIRVQNGVSVNTPIKIKKNRTSLYIWGAYGIPYIGYMGMEFYDEHDSLLSKNYTIPLQIHPFLPAPRPAFSQPDYPAILSHRVSFPISKNTNKTIINEIQFAKLIQINRNKKFLRTIDKSYSPWKQYADQ